MISNCLIFRESSKIVKQKLEAIAKKLNQTDTLQVPKEQGTENFATNLQMMEEDGLTMPEGSEECTK